MFVRIAGFALTVIVGSAVILLPWVLLAGSSFAFAGLLIALQICLLAAAFVMLRAVVLGRRGQNRGASR